MSCCGQVSLSFIFLFFAVSPHGKEINKQNQLSARVQKPAFLYNFSTLSYYRVSISNTAKYGEQI